MLQNFVWKTFVLSTVLSFCLQLNAKDKKPPEKIPEKPKVSVSADLLVWWAKESGTESWGQVFTTEGSSDTIQILDLSFGCDVGFRLGLDYQTNYDDWDTQWYYTYFRTQGKNHAQAPGDDKLTSAFYGNFFVNNPNGEGLSGPTYHQGSIKWTILFNMFDWELGRNYQVSKALALRPFIGLKSGWIHQSIHTTWRDPIGLDFSKATENLKNDFWGIGPEVGLNTKWDFGTYGSHTVGLFGDFSGALMWGHWSFRDIYKNDIDQVVSTNIPSINSAATTFRAFLGFEWDMGLYSERYRLAMQAGYEAQIWMDQLQFLTFNEGRLDNALTLQGATINARFSF